VDTQAIIMGGGFLLWGAVYLMGIRLGFKEKTFAIPWIAMCTNFSWEFLFAFVFNKSHPGLHPQAQFYSSLLLLAIDAVLIYLFVRYWRSDFPESVSEKWFLPYFLFGLLSCGGVVYYVTVEFQDWNGAYSAFGENVLTSALFLTMFLRRNSLLGQSLYIALAKMFGTILASISTWMFMPESKLLFFSYFLIFFLDALYTVLIYRKCKEEGVNPWKRF